MDSLSLDLMDGGALGYIRVIGPYFRDHLRRRGKSGGGLGLFLSSKHRIKPSITDPNSEQSDQLAEIVIYLDHMPSWGPLVEVLLDLLAFVPREEIISLQTTARVSPYPRR